MEFRVLRYFLAVAREESISRAAEFRRRRRTGYLEVSQNDAPLNPGNYL